MAYTQADLKYYKSNPEEITSDLDTELILELIDFAPENIERIKPQTEEFIQRAYDRDPQVFKYVDFGVVHPTFLEQVIDAHPKYIRYIYSPSIDLIKRALVLDINVMPFVDMELNELIFEQLVTVNGLALQYVPEIDQTIRMTELAIENNLDAYEFAYVKSKETDIYVIQRDPSKIPLLTDFWPELIDILITYNPRYITKFYDSNPELITESRLKTALTADPKIFKTIPDPDLEIMRFTLALDIDMFVYMPYSTNLLEYALETNGLILKYYKKKDLRTIKAALNLNVRALDFLEYPRQFLIDYAFNADGYALKYLRDPDYDQCLDAVKRNWMAMEFVPAEFKDRDIQLYALAGGGTAAIPFLGPPAHDEVIMQLLNLEPSYIFKVDNPSSGMYAAAFKTEGQLILFFPNWNDMFGFDEISAALSQDGTIFEHVKYKTKRLALIAIEEFPRAIMWTMGFQDLEIAKAAIQGDARTIFFVKQEVLDEELLALALFLDPDYFTRIAGEMSWEEWITLIDD